MLRLPTEIYVHEIYAIRKEKIIKASEIWL